MKESKIFSEQNLTEKVHYVYRVTIDGYYYIGKRTGCLNDLKTGRYKTSSNIIKEKLRNGSNFSKIKILKVFSSSKDALEFESRILTRLNAKTNKKFLNQSNSGGDFTCKQHTEKAKEKMKEHFNPETKEGRKNREINSEKRKEYYKTEEGRKQREIRSENKRKFWDKNTEEGIKRREDQSNKRKEYFNPETEEGRRNLEKRSQISLALFDINTEEGRKRCENHSKIMKEKAKEQLQKRQNDSVLGELMFDEDFIRENFLITDDKNKPRFLWSVYSKLTGFSRSFINVQKREGKLSFLYGIRSISITEELENAKIEAIEAIIKSRVP